MADSRKTVTVWRNNTKVDLHQSFVMVGDIIQIFEGMEIPADCFVLEAAELSTDVIYKNYQTIGKCNDGRDRSS